jgi:hypothetical protein
MTKQWRCFHCDEVFDDAPSAREHFGTSLMHEPACQIDIAKFREMERRVELCNAEDSDLHREIHKAESDGRQAARRAEEAGYARGLADGMDPKEKQVVIATFRNGHKAMGLFSDENVHGAFMAGGCSYIEVVTGDRRIYSSLAEYYAANPKAV